MYVSTISCPCIDLTSTITLGGGNVNAFFLIIKLNLTNNLGLIGILGFTLSIPHGGIKL